MASLKNTKVSYKNCKWLRWLAWIFTIGCLTLCAAYLGRARLLAEVAHEWIINDPATQADAIVVLGGGIDTRPFAAIKLYQAGVAPKILYMNVKPASAQKWSLNLTEAEVTHRILLSNNIPEAAMEAIGTNVASTYDESFAVRAWVKQNSARSIVITTDLFHTRRARWVFRKELRDTHTEISMVAVNLSNYDSGDWWRHEQGVIDFQNEIIKSAYYWFEY